MSAFSVRSFGHIFNIGALFFGFFFFDFKKICILVNNTVSHVNFLIFSHNMVFLYSLRIG